MAVQRLKEAAEKAKIELSSSLQVSYLHRYTGVFVRPRPRDDADGSPADTLAERSSVP